VRITVDGKPWSGKKIGDHTPLRFMPTADEVWTVYPGWKAAKDQVVHCYRCFSDKVLAEGGMNGWWATPNHTDKLTCMVCGDVIAKHDNQPFFVKKERTTSFSTVW
jgi:hypothetical protein